MRAWQRLTHLLAPPVCALCGADGQSLDEPWGLDLCTHCEQACPHVPGPCPRCGLPSGGTAPAACEQCRASPPPFDAVYCPFRYADPVDQMITQLKFHHDLAFARVLGTLLARALRASQRPLPDCVIPMPLHPSRYRERGFNQSALIARHLARRMRLADGQRLAVRGNLLQRMRHTAAQSRLTATERAANLACAFQTPAGRDVPRHVALLDDVMTTGHTAAAAAAALKLAGCREVEVWACARAL